MWDAPQGKEAQYMTDLDLVPNCFDQNPSSIGASLSLPVMLGSVVPGSSHDEGRFFPVFADSETNSI